MSPVSRSNSAILVDYEIGPIQPLTEGDFDLRESIGSDNITVELPLKDALLLLGNHIGVVGSFQGFAISSLLESS